MDDLVRLPTGHRIGLDGLVGLIPGVGDVAGAVISSVFLITGYRVGAPRSVLLRMAGNIVTEMLIGAIPVAGDLFDVVYRANVRNYQLLSRYLESPEAVARRSLWTFIGFVLLLAGILFSVLIGLFALARLLVMLLGAGSAQL